MQYKTSCSRPILRSLLPVVVAILILVLVPPVSAQSVATDRSSQWDPSVSYKGGGAHFLQRQQANDSAELDSVFMPFSLTMGMSQNDIRFLAYREVQEELELSDGQLAGLKTVLNNLNRLILFMFGMPPVPAYLCEPKPTKQLQS